MVPNAEIQNQLIHSKFLREEDKVGSSLIAGFNAKLLVVETNVSDLRPWEGDFGCELILLFINIEPKCRHTQPKLTILFVLKRNQK